MVTWYVVYTTNGSLMAKFIFRSDAEVYIATQAEKTGWTPSLEVEYEE